MRKRLSVILLLVLSAILTQLSINCSKPLEFSDGDPTDVDTIYLTDTLFFVDTVYITDSSDFCARLSASRQSIVWILNNDPGNFNLKFLASIESGQPPQKLIITIGEQEFLWSPVEGLEFTFDLDLNENALITIISDNPHAYGHAIDICLYVEEK